MADDDWTEQYMTDEGWDDDETAQEVLSVPSGRTRRARDSSTDGPWADRGEPVVEYEGESGWQDEAEPAPGSIEPSRPGRVPEERVFLAGARWTHVVLVGLICAAVWLVLDAPSLQRAAQVSPVGTRRTVSMDVVGPIAALSRTLGLSEVVHEADQVMGRTTAGPQMAVLVHPSTSAPPHVLPTVTEVTYPPSATNPLPVLIVGDSLGVDLGGPLVSTLAAFGDVHPTLDAKVDTGLARPDYFNWPGELAVDMVNLHPRVVVIMIGANDNQGIVDHGVVYPFATPGWRVVYAQRVKAFIDTAVYAGAKVLWVGQPPMEDPTLNRQVHVIDSIDQAEVAQVGAHYAAYLSSIPVLSNGTGKFTPFITEPGGVVVTVRDPDGIHLTPAGSQFLANAATTALQGDFGIRLVAAQTRGHG